MVIDLGDEDDGKTQQEREDRRPDVPEGKSQLPSGADPFRHRNPDIDDEKRQRNGEDAIAESFEPCAGVRVWHGQTLLGDAILVSCPSRE